MCIVFVWMLLAWAIQFLLGLDECCSTAVKLWWCKGTALICVYGQGLASAFFGVYVFIDVLGGFI